jgi:hypothetical protein
MDWTDFCSGAVQRFCHIDAIKQVEQGMGDAMVAGDIDKLNQIYADDFKTIGSGKIITRETMPTDFKSFHDKLE